MSSTRGRAGKYNKARRGGGRQFSKGLRPLDKDGAERSMWAEDAPGSDEEDDSEEDSEEDSSDNNAPTQQQDQADMTREERRAAAKAKKDAAIRKKKGTPAVGDMPSDSGEESEEDDMPANPNHTASARKQAEKAVADPTAAAKPDEKIKKPEDMSQLSRREREALQKQQAKERYDKLHAEGKTEEARADMERLKLVRQQREEAAARKDAEKQEKEMVEKEKREQLERMERQAKLKAARGGKGAKKGGKA